MRDGRWRFCTVIFYQAFLSLHQIEGNVLINKFIKRQKKMKPTVCSALLLLLFTMASGTLAAQSRRGYGRPSQRSNEPPFVVGFAPISLLTRSGKFNVRGEWGYAPNKSLSVTVGVPRRSKLPDWMANDIEVDENGAVTTTDYRALSVIVENRFYFGEKEKSPRGFYLAPYARYHRLWLTHATVQPEPVEEIRITGAVSGIGGGGAAGWQFGIGDHVTVDMTFIGIDFKWFRGAITYSNSNPDNDVEAFRAKVEDAVKDIPLVGKKLTPEVNGSEIKVRTPGWVLPGYRFNLTVGYNF